MQQTVSGGRVISREYLKYSGKGSEKEAIRVIDRDYNMAKFRQQIQKYNKEYE